MYYVIYVFEKSLSPPLRNKMIGLKAIISHSAGLCETYTRKYKDWKKSNVDFHDYLDDCPRRRKSSRDCLIESFEEHEAIAKHIGDRKSQELIRAIRKRAEYLNTKLEATK